MEQKITVIKEGKETIILCPSPKARDTKKGLKLLMKAQSADSDKEIVVKMDEYLDFLDETAAKYTGMTIDELDDLDTNDKDKILLVYQEGVSSKIDFLMSSLKRAN